MPNFRFIGAMVSEFRFFKKKMNKFEKIIFTYISDLMIFSSIFLHAVTFSHVLHLDVLRIDMYGYNAEQPIAIPIYAVLPYCAILASCNIILKHNENKFKYIASSKLSRSVLV